MTNRSKETIVKLWDDEAFAREVGEEFRRRAKAFSQSETEKRTLEFFERVASANSRE